MISVISCHTARSSIGLRYTDSDPSSDPFLREAVVPHHLAVVVVGHVDVTVLRLNDRRVRERGVAVLVVVVVPPGWHARWGPSAYHACVQCMYAARVHQQDCMVHMHTQANIGQHAVHNARPHVQLLFSGRGCDSKSRMNGHVTPPSYDKAT